MKEKHHHKFDKISTKKEKGASTCKRVWLLPILEHQCQQKKVALQSNTF